MDDAELLKLFWTEVREYLDQMNNTLMALEMSTVEDDAGNFVERLRELNRVAHSMKGAARAVGEREVEALGHHMEEVFDAGLKRGLALTPDVADYLYDALDMVGRRANGETIDEAALEAVTDSLQRVVIENALSPEDAAIADVPRPEWTTGPQPSHDSNEFPAVTNGSSVPSEPAPTPPPTLADTPASPPPSLIRSAMNETMLMRPAEDTVRVSIDKLDRLMQESSRLLVMRLQGEERQRQVAELRQLHNRWAKSWRAVRTSYIRLARRLQTETGSDDLRALLEFLDLNQRMLAESSRGVGTLMGAVTYDSLRLATLTDELQDSISSLRLIPFDTVLGTLHRTLRDAARETGKEVHMDVIGGDTEIDKRVLDHLRDPIMHIIRNAVDHAIEDPAARLAAGKPKEGWIYISVETRGSEMTVMVADDGQGIDPAAVRQAALDAQIISRPLANSMSDAESQMLIFHPGFSTRNQVTPLSGRGVGMDVVRNRVEGLRGRVSLTSTPGEGTTITLSVPLSLTRIRSVMLSVGGEQYALPSLAVQRMERVSSASVFTAEGRPVVTLGERTLPLLYLADSLDVPRAPLPTDEPLRVLVLRAADRQVALVVDHLLAEQELVLKPLGAELAETPYISGAALLGSGEVILMLDANDLVRSASGARPQRRPPAPAADAAPPPQQLRVLIADDSITTRTLEKNILETAGCYVQVAFDGVQAWEMLNGGASFDVVVSDVEMPRMDGLALTKRIKASPATQDIPVVLLTSLKKPEHREAGLRAGADAYLVKSRFDQDELLRAVQSVL